MDVNKRIRICDSFRRSNKNLSIWSIWQWYLIKWILGTTINSHERLLKHLLDRILNYWVIESQNMYSRRIYVWLIYDNFKGAFRSNYRDTKSISYIQKRITNTHNLIWHLFTLFWIIKLNIKFVLNSVALLQLHKFVRI